MVSKSLLWLIIEFIISPLLGNCRLRRCSAVKLCKQGVNPYYLEALAAVSYYLLLETSPSAHGEAVDTFKKSIKNAEIHYIETGGICVDLFDG